MKTLRDILVCALLGCAAACLASLAYLGAITARTVAAIPGEIQVTRTEVLREIDSQANSLRTLADETGKNVLRAASAQISTTRGDLLAATDSVVKQSLSTADRRIGDTLARVDVALGTIDAVRKDAQPILTHAGSVAAQVDDAAPLFLDCDHNPDCAFNRFQGTSKAIERTAQVIAQAAPTVSASAQSVGKSVAGIADDAHREADEFLRPKTFRQKLADWLSIIPRVAKIVL